MAGDNGLDLPYVGTNPSGVGNAVLPSDLADDLQKINESTTTALGEYATERQKKADENAQALAGLNPNLQGIMEEDTPYFQKQTQAIFDLATKAVSTGKSIKDPSNQYYWQLQSAINNNLAEINQSKGQKTDLLEYSKDWLAHPENYAPTTMGNVSDIRFSGGPVARQAKLASKYGGSIAGAFVSSTPSMEKIINNAFSGKEGLMDQVATITKDAAGNPTINTVKSYKPDRVQNIMGLAYTDPQTQRWIDQNYQKNTTSDERTYYNQRALIEGAAKGKAVAPAVLWSANLAGGAFPTQDSQNAKFNPANIAFAREAAKNENEDVVAKMLIDKLRLMKDNPDAVFGEKTPLAGTAMNYLPTAIGGPIAGEAIAGGYAPRFAQFSWPLGQAAMPKFGKYAADDPKNPGMVNYSNVVDPVGDVKPNQLLGYMEMNGKLYKQTTQGQQYALSPDYAKYGVDQSGYAPVDINREPDELLKGYANKDALRAAMIKYGTKVGVFNNGAWNFEKAQTKPASAPVKTTTKTYTPEQEGKISANLKANPAYTREEIINALGY